MRLKLLEDLDLLIEQGLYESKDELLEDAVRTLLRTRPELRQKLALALYARGRVSLARAAEMAGLDQEAFKALLHDVGIAYRIPSVGKHAVHEEVNLLRAERSDSDIE